MRQTSHGWNKMGWIFTTTFYLSVIKVAFCSNIEPWKPIVNDAAGFGYQVVQTPSGLLVSAPFAQPSKNEKGQIFKCNETGCQSLNNPVPEVANMSLGLAMAIDPDTNEIVACGPTVPKKCLEITKYSGVCLEMKNGEFQKPKQPSAPECQTKLDVVFLLDGSGSLSEDDFDEMKTFVGKLLDSLVGLETQFAVVQFGTNVRIHINFKEFQDENWSSQLEDVKRLEGFTNTATAITTVLDDVFTRSGGSRPDAKKILIVVTDGKTTEPKKLGGALKRAESEGITRFAIGIGDASTTREGLEDLKLIASKPEENHIFKVEKFAALDGIRQALQDKLFSIEGSQATGESLTMELSQEGFRAAIVPGGIQMTIVGANQWRGGYKRYEGPAVAATFEPMDIEPDSYLGYSMALAKTAKGLLTILGAPRYEHRGLVVSVFEDKEQQKLEPNQRQSQIGEYFGAEVCTMDVDLDNLSDLILISAPMYKDSNREGRVYICTLTKLRVDCHFESPLVLKGVASSKGRFGSSLAVLPDLNSDGFNDLAIGAPLENDGQGSIYIFYAEVGYRFNPTYSQRIPAFEVKSGLKYFGMSISQSTFDQTGDGLPDLAVGSKGAVLILSMPLVAVVPTVFFEVKEIPTQTITCSTPLLNVAKICFSMTRQSKVKRAQAQINYTFTLDATRKTPNNRAYTKEKQQEETGSLLVDLSEPKCKSVDVFIKPCPEDIQNPLLNKLSFNFIGLSNDKDIKPRLAPWAQTLTPHPLKFQINCLVNGSCKDNLKVDLKFDRSELIVGLDEVLNVIVSVENQGENSHNAYISLTYPAGLSYRKVTATQGRILCNPIEREDSVTRGKTGCSIEKPVFRSNSKVVFTVSYGIGVKTQFARKILVTANATSENEEHSPSSELFKEEEIVVKYNIFVSVKSYLNYCNFTFGKFDLLKPIEQLIEVTNNIRTIDLKVVIRVPVELGDKKIWNDFTGLQIAGCQYVKYEEAIVTDFLAKIREKNHVVDCSVAHCKVFNCTTSLERYKTKTYAISANLSSAWIEQIGLTSAKFELISTASLEYDRDRYFFHSAAINREFPVYEIKTVVEVYPVPDFTLAIVGGCLGGLFLLILLAFVLYKAGFFKSKYNEMLENGEEAKNPEADGLVGK